MVKGFTTRKVIFYNDGKKSYKLFKSFHWTYNNEDEVYYRDDVDDLYVYEPIKNGIKTFCLTEDAHARYLVIND